MTDETQTASVVTPVSDTTQPGSGEGSSATTGAPDGETAAAPRRTRSRRGGRGRGRGSGASRPDDGSAGDRSTGTSTAGSSDADGTSEAPPKPAPTRARADATDGAPKPSRPPRKRTPATSTPSGTDEPSPPDSDGSDPEPGTPAAGTSTAAPRRRRRGGRGRGPRPAAQGGDGDASQPRSISSSDAEAKTETDAETDGSMGGDGADGTSASPSAKRRRRRSRAKKPVAGDATAETLEAGPKKATPARTRRAKSQEPREPKDSAPTSTRLTRSRVGRTARRRREPMPYVPRVTDKLMVITEHGERDQIAVLEERELVQHYVTRAGAKSMVGNVYLGRVQNVLPGMEAAFVDVGRGRNAVLYAGEVNWSLEDLEGAPPRIEHVLKNGQSVLVQVTKDPIGGKGARLTAQISLPGRYLVLAPNSNVTGISRRLPDDERKRLKGIYKSIKPESHGLIVRTAAEGATEEALAADVQRLLATWQDIEKRSKKAKVLATLYEEPELTVRVVRDLFTDEEFRELVTDSPRVYGLVTDYLRDVAPDTLEKVRLHEGKLPVFEEFHIVEQIHKGLDRKVWLPSGGYLVIDRTEAMTVIDVNTGKSVGKTNLEETVVNTNVEASAEVARQLRLRDIGGMIIIDFIDMLLEQNKKKVIDTLKEALAQDKSRSQVFDITPLGLLEVTRKRVSGGLLEAFSETCPTCEGRGVLLTYDVN